MFDQPPFDPVVPRADLPAPAPMPQELTAQSAPTIVVIGSINMDLVIKTYQMPRPGQTIHACDFSTIPGGKGANQAVAAARMNAWAIMIGCLGKDAHGRQLLDHLKSEKVDTQYIRTTEDRPSGVALIQVDKLGENAITVVAGANAQLCPDDINCLEKVISKSAAVLCQLEVPLATICTAIHLARKHKVLTVLDPAPTPQRGLPDEFFKVDVLSPNQTEAELLTGEPASSVAEAKLVAAELVRRGARQVVLKLGGAGAVIVTESGHVTHIPAYQTPVTDTTAAGDAFTAALTVGLAEGHPIELATRMGCAAGALAVRTFGAGQSMPTRQAVQRLMRSRC